MKIVIATPFYEIKGYSPYIVAVVNSLKALTLVGIEWDYGELSGDSYVDRAKNTIANNFIKSGYDYLMMIDSDMSWNIEGFLKVAMSPHDVVGGSYPNKNNWESYGAEIIYNDQNKSKQDNFGAVEALYLPGGFIKYSVNAFESVKDSVKRYIDPGNGTDKEMEFYEFFRCDISNSGARIGEDVYFCNKLREAGIPLNVIPDIEFHHWGVKGYSGNFHEFLTKRSREFEAATIEAS